MDLAAILNLFTVIMVHYISLAVFFKPQLHIHGFGPGRATVHPDLSNRGASA